MRRFSLIHHTTLKSVSLLRKMIEMAAINIHCYYLEQSFSKRRFVWVSLFSQYDNPVIIVGITVDQLQMLTQ